MLSSKVHLDLVSEARIASLRKRLGVARLHANELGDGRLAMIAGDLADVQRKFQIRFDLFGIVKADHAIICFFDQVFDQGMNPAITWSGYWTPMRYVLLLKLEHLFDRGLAERAWAARINLDNDAAQRDLTGICRELHSRVSRLPDARSRQLIGDTLTWAAANPAKISYNTTTREQRLQVTPNIIGFQSVMHGIAQRLRHSGRAASRIIVDRQSQFDKSQRTLAEWYGAASGMQMPMGPGLPEINFKGMPTIPIEFEASTDSAGLELVDIYLWIFKRLSEGKDLPGELMPFIDAQIRYARTDKVSLRAIEDRWTKWERSSPQLDEFSEEQMAKGRELHEIDEGRRLASIAERLVITEATASSTQPTRRLQVSCIRAPGSVNMSREVRPVTFVRRHHLSISSGFAGAKCCALSRRIEGRGNRTTGRDDVECWNPRDDRGPRRAVFRGLGGGVMRANYQ